MNARRTRQAQTDSGPGERALAWPGDPSAVAPESIDFEALAHVLANTCVWGGRSRRFHSLAARAVIASEEIAALGGLREEDRRVLALHALLADARAAWLGGADGPAPAKAAERARREGAGIDRAVIEAAGLEPELPGEWAELLRFVRRMTAAAERRDLPGAAAQSGAGNAFPPLKRRIGPVGPGRAARLWLDRFHALKGPPRDAGAARSSLTTETEEEEKTDVTHIPATKRETSQTPRAERGDRRDAA